MIKSISAFMTEVSAYFVNGFPNETVQSRFAEKLSYVNPESLNRLFDVLIESFPSSFTPDVKALKDAIEKGGFILAKSEESICTCKVCNTTWSNTGYCPECGYDKERHGTTEQHKAWYTSWKAGKEPKINMLTILDNIVRKNRITEEVKNG